jgi:hypothetical protein
MPAKVTFIDTSVLCELLEVPGMCAQHEDIRTEFELRDEDGERFVVPITAVIETGNHIAHAAGDRRAAAERFVRFLAAAGSAEAPFTVHRLSWDDQFLVELCEGNGTGQPFIDLANGQMGAGDVAILVERDRFQRDSAYTEVQVWTLDEGLGAYG